MPTMDAHDALSTILPHSVFSRPQTAQRKSEARVEYDLPHLFDVSEARIQVYGEHFILPLELSILAIRYSCVDISSRKSRAKCSGPVPGPLLEIPIDAPLKMREETWSRQAIPEFHKSFNSCFMPLYHFPDQRWYACILGDETTSTIDKSNKRSTTTSEDLLELPGSDPWNAYKFHSGMGVPESKVARGVGASLCWTMLEAASS